MKKIAVLSGKGGTGKTTLATNLFITMGKGVLIDADVEEPNSHLFLKPNIQDTKVVKKKYPNVDQEKCNLCGACGDFCRYNAILPAKNKVLVFKELCHDCGGCQLVCQQNAITYKERAIGKISTGQLSNGLTMHYGDLTVGEVSGVPIIEQLHRMVEKEDWVWIDSPPGTSCTTVAALEGVDFALIVAEPTPFGLSDMKMVVELLEERNIDMAVVVNKAGLGDQELHDFCATKRIDVLAEIPFQKDYAAHYASGELLSVQFPEYKKIMEQILDRLLKKVGN